MRWFCKLFFVSAFFMTLFYAVRNDAVQEVLGRAFTPLAHAQEQENAFFWGIVKILHDKNALEEVSQEDDATQLLRRNVQITSKSYLPQDVVIGALEDNASKSAVKRRVLMRVRSFVRDIQQKKIHGSLQDHVVSDSIVLVSRQITRAREYATYIEDTRIGRVRIGDGKERHAKVRIIGRGKKFKSHAILRMYFQKEKDVWKISAIEGALDTLLNPYTPSGVFSPTGTLGITQTL